jgi:hypothetical protein
MKKYMLAISVVLLMLGAAIAQEKAPEPQKPEKAPKVEAKAIAGEVTSIDATKNEIVIKDDAGAEVRLLISTTTKITKAGKGIAFGDVKVGDKVASECEASADGCNAKSLAVIPPPPPPGQ